MMDSGWKVSPLARSAGGWQGPPVNFSRLPLILLTLVFAAGCAATPRRAPSSAPRYYKVTSTDLRGQLVAAWTAEGTVWKYEGGYRFNAVERTSGPPLMVYSRYAHGRRTVVTGPAVTITRTGQPAWLRSMALYGPSSLPAETWHAGDRLTPVFPR